MSHIDLLGYVAGALTTYAFWPQLQKTLSTKSAADVSLGMLTIFTTGVGLWLCYGVVLGAWPIILTNGVTLLLTSAILILKLRYQS
jgi:MtN3 and saliva related transmembrane protein